MLLRFESFGNIPSNWEGCDEEIANTKHYNKIGTSIIWKHLLTSMYKNDCREYHSI